MPNASAVFGRFSDTSENAIAIAVSLLLHGLLIFVLVHHWVPEKEEKQAIRPKFVNAKLLQMKPAVAAPAPKPKPKEQPKPVVQPKPKVDEAAIKRQQQEKQRQQEAAREEAQRKEQARQQEVKRQQELKRQEEVKRQQQREKEVAERKRQEEVKRQQESARQKELADALALEDEALEDEQAESEVGTYIDYMASLIATNWSRPPGTRNGMQVLLQITLGSAGRVTGVQVVKSSGNAAFDRSAEQAVLKVGQFARLKEMDPVVYQREFRRVNILFNPQDLRM